MALSVSLPFDQRLAHDDLAGSRAHVDMLASVGLLTEEERFAIADALDQVGAELNDGHVRVRADRRGHPHRDRAPGHRDRRRRPGAKLHTGRSRNDQVALDLRLWVRREAHGDRSGRIHDLQTVLVRRAEECDDDAYLPGYTHLQRAQPVLLAHHLLAHLWALTRDVERWQGVVDAAPTSRRSAPARSPARACRSIPTTSPTASASRTGSRTRSTRCPTATSSPRRCSPPRSPRCTSRGSARRSCSGRARSSASCSCPTRSRPARRCCRRRRTPTSPSWRAGKAGRLIGHLTGLLATLKGLPLAYNRDLQEDKEPLFDAVETLRAHAARAQRAARRRVRSTTPGCAPRPTSPASSATDLAEHLVRGGHAVPRGARGRRRARPPVGRAPHPARGAGRGRAAPRRRRAARSSSRAARCGAGRRPAAPGPEPVAVQLEAARDRLRRQQQWLDD